MEKEMNIILEGEKLSLRKMEQPELKSIDANTLFSFDFYAAEYNGCEFVLLEPNEKGSKRYTLTQFSNLSKAVNDVFGKPIAFLFDHRIYHEENLMPNNRGVYFIYSDEYAFLPFLFEEQPYCVRRIETNRSCL
jgi:hypothetical protein